MQNANPKMDISREIEMSYEEYVQYLLAKYGPAQYDYFCTAECRSKNRRVSKTTEGLFCHHIDENKEILLSTPEVARTQPFAYQKADRLVYANYLEHLLLHIKIVEEDDEEIGLGLGGVIMINGTINDFYRHKKASGWKKAATECLKNGYDDYILMMRHFETLVESRDDLRELVRPPILAQGWYGQINPKVHNDVYNARYKRDTALNNQDVLTHFGTMNNNAKKMNKNTINNKE